MQIINRNILLKKQDQWKVYCKKDINGLIICVALSLVLQDRMVDRQPLTLHASEGRLPLACQILSCFGFAKVYLYSGLPLRETISCKTRERGGKPLPRQ